MFCATLLGTGSLTSYSASGSNPCSCSLQQCAVRRVKPRMSDKQDTSNTHLGTRLLQWSLFMEKANTTACVLSLDTYIHAARFICKDIQWCVTQTGAASGRTLKGSHRRNRSPHHTTGATARKNSTCR